MPPKVYKAMSCFSWIFMFIQIIVNLGSLVFNMYVVIFCPYFHCGYFYIGNISDYNKITNNHTIDAPVKTLREYGNWNKFQITTATLGGTLSYIIITLMVLLPLYSQCLHYKCCIRCGNNGCVYQIIKVLCNKVRKSYQSKVAIFSPFCDEEGKPYSTVLKQEELFWFYIFYTISSLLYWSSFGVFLYIMVSRVSKVNETGCAIDETGLILQFISQLCAIQSCFIFSKVAYQASKCFRDLHEEFKEVDNTPFNELEEKLNALPSIDESNDQIIRDLFTSINTPGANMEEEKENRAYLYMLQNIDQYCIKRVKNSIQPYALWFTVHWLLYTLTTFLSIAFLTETLFLYLYDTNEWYDSQKNDISLAYITLFTAEHTFLFLYPCFRAANVGSAREKLISRVAKTQWKHIRLPVQTQFMAYLDKQNFGFQLSLFCANINFGFNFAFVSVFIGLFGVMLKMSNSV